MDDTGIRLVGMRHLRKALIEAGDDLSDLKDTHKQAATLAADGARRLVPTRTNALGKSIRPAGTKTAAIVRSGSKRVPYAHAIQWGRKWWPSARTDAPSGRAKHFSFIKPSLFLTQGAKNTEPAWVALFEATLDKALSKIEGDTP